MAGNYFIVAQKLLDLFRRDNTFAELHKVAEFKWGIISGKLSQC